MIPLEDLAKKIYRRWYNKDWPTLQSTSERMAMEAAEVSIAALARKPVGEWQPIETATHDRIEQVLLWFPHEAAGFIYIGVWGYPDDNSTIPGPCWIDPMDCEPLGNPTHWMLLPGGPSPNNITVIASKDS